MEASPHLSLVDPNTGELVDQPTVHALEAEVVQLREDAAHLEMELRTKRAAITRLKNENARLMGVEPEHRDVLDVLTFACERLMPNASIVVGERRWKAVRARLRDTDAKTSKLSFTPLELKGAAIGAALDPWTMEPKQRHRRDPEFVFADAGKVDRYLAQAKAFKRTAGVSALTIVDELAGEGIRWLAERCSCGHVWLSHLRGGEAAQGGAHRCSECVCPMFDAFHAKVERFMREQP